VCEFNFDETYSKDYAHGYIQIHHIKPISEYEREVDSETDLVPLYVNCHAMAHRRRDTVTSIKELRALIVKAKRSDSSARSACIFAIINRLGLLRPFRTRFRFAGSISAPLAKQRKLGR